MWRDTCIGSCSCRCFSGCHSERSKKPAVSRSSPTESPAVCHTGPLRGQMISRRTILFFLVAVLCVGVIKYQTWEQDRPCREWKHHHSLNEPDPAPIKQPDGNFTVTMTPCDFFPETSLADRLVALLGFASAVAFIISLIQDLLRWLKRRARRLNLSPE